MLNFLAQAIINLLKYALFRNKNQRKYKRIFLASVVVKAITLKLEGQHELAYEYIQCLQMYFTATTEPLLTIFEVKSLLSACCSIIGTLRFYNIFYQEFNVLMPGCPAVIEPRKLSDLARCQVWQNLSNCNLLLPEAIEKLDLPRRVKIFLFGDLIDISKSVVYRVINNEVAICNNV